MRPERAARLKARLTAYILAAAEIGCAFRPLLDGVLRERARVMLVPAPNRATMAAALGYTDATSFSRALTVVRGARVVRGAHSAALDLRKISPCDTSGSHLTKSTMIEMGLPPDLLPETPPVLS